MSVVENGVEKIACIHCNRALPRKHFYMDKNRNPFAKCKDCQTMHIDLSSPSSFRQLFEEIDIPYIPSQLDVLIERYGSKPGKGGIRGSTKSIIGRYIGKMKLEQFRHLTYADTERIVEEERLQKEKANRIKDEEFEKFLKEGLTEEEARDRVEGVKIEFDLGEIFTREEKKNLVMKWGPHYTNEELLKLETFYNNMHASFDISSASHEDYLMQISKVSLRMHAAIDASDFEGHNKLSGTYDKLMKSAKFTASQEKVEEKFMDSLSEMARLCESKGFIPVYHTDEPQDIVDVTLRDLKNYTKNLVEKEHNLGSLIESSAKLIQMEEEKDNMDSDEITVDGLFEEDIMGIHDLPDMTNHEVEELDLEVGDDVE